MMMMTITIVIRWWWRSWWAKGSYYIAACFYDFHNRFHPSPFFMCPFFSAANLRGFVPSIVGCLSNFPFFILFLGFDVDLLSMLLSKLEGRYRGIGHRVWLLLVGCLAPALRVSLRLLSDIVEGFGANLPMLVLPYVIDWIVTRNKSVTHKSCIWNTCSRGDFGFESH